MNKKTKIESIKIDLQAIRRDIVGLRQHYLAGDFTPADLIDAIIMQRDKVCDNPIWISALSRQDIQAYLNALVDKDIADLPLYGVPFAIKDNIDLAGVPTTAGCEAYRFVPLEHAHVVGELLKAGAIPIGKTNLDQFATG